MSDAKGHDHDHHEEFDPEPATALAPDEPRTPNWIPVLGAVFVLVFGVYFLAKFTGDGPAKPGAASATSASAPAVVAKTAAKTAAPPAAKPASKPPASGRLQLSDSARANLVEKARQERERQLAASASANAGSAAPPAKPAPAGGSR